MLLLEDLFPENLDYAAYVKQHSIRLLLGDETVSDKKPADSQTESTAKISTAVAPLPPDYDDLCRLHYLCSSRRVYTVLEFGVGKSTIILTDAINTNRKDHGDYCSAKLRTKNAHEVHSVDNYEFWITKTTELMPNNLSKEKICHFHLSEVVTGSYCGKICTYYDPLPNICPDFIYIDGPDQFSALGDVRGISTRHPDRLPMSGDLLAIEHFLEPGTLVVVDGRTANARFLAKNLQRKWSYLYVKEWDQHFFELQEEPLGNRNKRKIDFCLGQEFYSRLGRR